MRLSAEQVQAWRDEACENIERIDSARGLPPSGKHINALRIVTLCEEVLNRMDDCAQGKDPTWVLITEPHHWWVEQTITVDAIERTVVAAIEANKGWRLLHAGTGASGQTTLTYGWPWSGDDGNDPAHGTGVK